MIEYCATTSDKDHKLGKFMLWRGLVAAILFVGLGWLTLSQAASGASERVALSEFANYSPAQEHGAVSGSHLPVQTSPAFSLTVLSTNDTWGYLDPCG